MTTDFKILSDAEHVLLRSGMYIGSTTLEEYSGVLNYEWSTVKIVPGLLKIVNEIIDNGVDEYIRTAGEFANKISISFGSDISGHFVEVSDNGRGIPLNTVGDTYQPVAAWTKARAGSNFSDDRETLGMNGVGSMATSVFSKEFIGTTSNGTDGIVVSVKNNCSDISFKLKPIKTKGTTVKFYPDLERFGLTEIDQHHVDYLRDRVENLAICYKGIQFTFNGEKIKFKSLKDIAKKFSEHCVLLDEDKISMIVAPSGEMEEFRALSYINGLNVKNGGTHIDFILNKITDALRTVIKKKYKFDVLPNQIKQHLLLATWVNGFKNLRFDSQSKERCTNTVAEVTAFFGDIDFDAIAKKVINTPEIIDPIVEAQIRKKEAQEAAELRKKNKDVDKANLRKISKFTDATQKEDRENCMLFVCEGDCLDESTEINVYTTDGIEKRMIKDIKIGDQVLTHKNRLRKVAHTFSKVDHFIEIKTSEGIIRCSKTHRLFVYNTVFDKFEIISAEQLNAKTHKLIKSKPSLSIHASLITEITHSEELYDLLIVHHDGEIYSTYEHKFMVLDIETEEYIFLTAKELIPFKHCFAFI